MSGEKEDVNKESNQQIIGAVRGFGALGIDFYLQSEGVPFGLASGLNSIADLMAGFGKRKWAAFAKRLTEIDPAIAESFTAKEFKNVDELKEFWEKELLDLSKFDDERKAKIKGQLLKAVIEQNIRVVDYRRMCLSLEQMLIVDINAFKDEYVYYVDRDVWTKMQRGKETRDTRQIVRPPYEQCIQLKLLKATTKPKKSNRPRYSSTGFGSSKQLTQSDIVESIDLETKRDLTTLGEQFIKFGLLD